MNKFGRQGTKYSKWEGPEVAGSLGYLKGARDPVWLDVENWQ